MFGVVKVTRKFQMVVIGATFGILLLYGFGFLLSLFGVDVMFWNQPSALGIIVSVVICCVASLNLFLDYEFIRQASINGAPKYMEWYGGFGIMVTLVWIYIEMLRLLSLLRNYGVRTGSFSHPRTLLVCACSARSQSTSHSGKRAYDLVERHAALEPCERGAEAEVDPVPEGQVVVDDAGDVEAVGIGEVALVVVRRPR